MQLLHHKLYIICPSRKFEKYIYLYNTHVLYLNYDPISKHAQAKCIKSNEGKNLQVLYFKPIHTKGICYSFAPCLNKRWMQMAASQSRTKCYISTSIGCIILFQCKNLLDKHVPCITFKTRDTSIMYCT